MQKEIAKKVTIANPEPAKAEACPECKREMFEAYDLEEQSLILVCAGCGYRTTVKEERADVEHPRDG